MKFKVGDKVKVLQTSYKNNCPVGHTATILSLYEDGYNLSGNNLMYKPDGWAFGFYEEDNLELVENMNQEIEVGDIVKIKASSRYYGNDNSNPANVEGTVDKKHSGGNFNVKWNNGEDDNYPPDHLELISKANKAEIVGYELLKDLPGIPAGSKGYKKQISYYFGEAPYMVPISVDIVEKDTTWFKPIYKPKEVIVKISKGREVTVNKVATIKGQGALTFDDVIRLHQQFTKNIILSSYKTTIKTIQVGCQEFTAEDINLVYQATQNLK